MREPDAQLRTPLTAAHAVYHLTHGETQVLAQVVNGYSLAEIADILGVARSTAKTHLDAVYRKTGTNRQSELVRVVMGLASPLRPDGEP
jgi:DNA-binding CsgD family transcriptional regulator